MKAITMIVKLVLLFLFLPIGIVGLIMTISDFDGINLFLTIIGLIIGITVARSLFQVPSRFFRKFEFNRLETNLDS